jgi:2-polyprenyl-6-methoxyphenol hydroxylase-like FAD-dependent oxidoreductase
LRKNELGDILKVGGLRDDRSDDERSAAMSHAVVLGGSIAGLLAARVLADHFERVTLFERDAVGREPVARKGVPQARHAHVLLYRGKQIFERLFPDLDATARARGTAVNVGDDFRWHHFGAWKPRYTSDLAGHVLSRALLEHEVARRVLAWPRVTVRDRYDVLGIVTTGDRISAVRVRAREDASAQAETIAADFVVDATGRGSKSPEWLEQLGRGKVAETFVPVDLAYASCVMRGLGGPAWKGMLVTPKPPATRTGAAFPVEDGTHVVTLAGSFGDHPPTDLDGWRAYAKALAAPDFHEAIAAAEALSPLVLFKFPGSRRRYYERTPRPLERYVVTGDAVCSFNPLYGQGMSVAALDAEAIGDALRAGIGGAARRAQRAIAGFVDVAWGAALAEDLRYPDVRVPRTPVVRALQWYTARLYDRSSTDAQTCEALYRVMHFVDPPAALMRPSVVWRVFGVGA